VNIISKGQVAGAVVIAVILSFALSYLVVPALPSIYPPTSTTQIKTVKANSTVQIDTNTNTLTPIPGMSLVITTNHDGRLIATFSSPADITLVPSASGRIQFIICLVIAGVGRQNTTIGYYTGAATTDYLQLYESLYLRYETGIVPAATYNATVYWYSHSVASQTCFLDLADPSFNYTRTLTLESLNA
jgi:hypothetical protein